MNDYTPADLTEGCRVSGTYNRLFTFTNEPAHRTPGGSWYIGSGPTETSVATQWGRWCVTVTDIKPAPKPVPLWCDPAIPDDAWIELTFIDGGTEIYGVTHMRSMWADSAPPRMVSVRRVWLLDDTEVAVKKADIAGIVQLRKTMPETARTSALMLLCASIDGGAA